MTRSVRWGVLLSGVTLLLAPYLSSAGGAAPERGDPAARLSPAPQATEYWELTAGFNSGYRLFARFGITNEGPGERTAGAIWYLVHPDGHVSEFRNGRVQGRWKLSPDRLRIDVASSTLDLHAPVRRLALDTTSQGAKIDLRFPAGGTPLWPAVPALFQTDALQLSAPIEGTIWVRGMPAAVAVRGHAVLTHAWMDESIASLVLRRIEFSGTTPDLALYLSDVTAPDGGNHRWLALERSGAVGYQSTDMEMVVDPAAPASADRSYPLPGRIVIGDRRITLTIVPQRLLLRKDPLDVLPQPFRFLFSLRIAPRWVWEEASFHLALAAAAGSAAVEAEGRGILAVNFLHPLPVVR